MKVIQVNQTAKRHATKSEKQIERAVKKIISYLRQKKVRHRSLLSDKKELTIVYLTPKQMKKINWQFRKKNKPTDILSFASHDPNSLGELLLCRDVLKKQAAEQGHSLYDETVYMLIHGVLHLLDYDHEKSKREEVLMFRIQDQCFQHLV